MKKEDIKKKLVFLVAAILTIVGTVGFIMDNNDNFIDVNASDLIKENISHKDNESTVFMETVKMFPVHIAGAIHNPGVYYMEEGSIVDDVVKAAGGLLDEADVSVINLAARITDGMKIIIYTKEQVESGEVTLDKEGNRLVNINNASDEELMTLPGIGESKAKAIIEYRIENGGFNKIEDIMNISGIKESVFNKVKDYITV